jgi:hypothetical protein
MEVVFTAILNKVQTTVDGGWRITLDISQEEAENILKLSQYRNQLLGIAVVPVKDENG